MFHRIQRYFSDIKPVWIDGSLYVALAFLGAIMITFNNDDVYKYFPYPVAVFWVKSIDEWTIAALTAIKMFRSTAYADHLDNKAMKDAGLKPAPILPPVVDKLQQTLNEEQLKQTIIDKINEKSPKI